jgi:putative Mg2+ transporter-C (MgtC) family protein
MGAFIGLEREKHGRPAGLRTHALVSLGSCLIMLISIYGFNGITGRDPARLAAQVVSGIGFLGAGTIIREGTSIRGLTTAASLWVVAGIGLAIGSGFYFAGITATFLSVLVLVYLENLEKKLNISKTEVVEAVIKDRPGILAMFCQIIANNGISIKNINLEIDEENEKALISFQIKGYNIDKAKVIEEISEIPDIYHIKWN